MEKLITEMDTEEFDAVINAYIEREAQDTGEIPAPLFYKTLRDIFQAERKETEQIPLHMESTVAGRRLILSLPPDLSLPKDVQEVEINLPGVHVLVNLESFAT